MATSQTSQQDEPPYPSYREIRSDGLPMILSPNAAQRLFWPFDGIFPASISVMKTSRSPKSLEPYVKPGTEGNSGGTWHEISQLPLTEPKISSVEVSVYDLDQWEYTWLEQHREHTGGNAEYILYGDLSDDDRPYPSEMKEDGGWESDSDTEFLMRCCDQDRPLRKAAKLLVKPSAGNDFVTVHDYVSAVHPWLMSLREDILKAMTNFLGYPPSLPTEFMVSKGPDMLWIEDKERWLQWNGGSPKPPRFPIPPSFLNKLRRDRLAKQEAQKALG
ncbi:hypothetical protein VE03_03314 [Pseudogymnoascus sp. 23342-1-I1]|nr:hypothetical protein VE03_03314 [Pseudogymnoascus sp. 23342-1-I1]